MTTCVSNCGTDLGEMNDVSEWEEECGFVPYDPRYEDGWNHCNSNDVGYDWSPYEASIEAANCPQGSEGFGIVSNDENSIRGCDFARGSRVETGINYSYAYPDTNSQQNLEQSSPHSGACKGTNYNYESCYQVNGYVHDYNHSYATAGINGYEHDDEHNCDDDDCVDYNVELPNSDGVKDEINRGFGSQYAGFYHVEAMGSAVMRGHEHEPDFEHYNAVSSADLCDHSNVGQPEFDSRLESCVKEHEDMCRAMNSLMHKMNRFIEKEKRKKEEASLLCVEQRRLASDVVVTKEQTSTEMEVHLAASIPVLEEKQCSDETVFVNDQKLAGVEMEWIDSDGCMIDHELAESKNNLLRKVSDEKEGKTEPSVCLNNAMRCLEIQRKFWAIGSSFSVIPAVPLHQFIDPFLEGLEAKQQLKQAPFEPSKVIRMAASKDQGFLGLGRSNLRFAAWTEVLRQKY